MGSSRPGLASQFLSDHDDPWRIRGVAVRQQSATGEPYGEQPQVVRRHHAVTGDWHVGRVEHRLSLDRVERIERRALQGDVRGDARVGDARDPAHCCGQALDVGRAPPMIREHARRQRQLRAGDAAGSKSQVGGAQSGEAAQDETSADEQENGDGDLRSDEKAESRPLAACEPGARARCRQRQRHARLRMVPRVRDDGDQDRRHHRDTRTDGDHEHIDADVGQRRRQRRGLNRTQCAKHRRQPGGERQAGGAARQPDSQRFRQPLERQLTA
jgi:hypothetical protein